MGEVRVRGKGSLAFIQHLITNDASTLEVCQAQYTVMTRPDGGIIDDLIVYRLAEEAYLVVPNAANRETVAAELRTRLTGYDATLEDETPATSLVAVQGPAAAGIVGALTDADLPGLRNYSATSTTVAGLPVLLARTGYTGEDGFEIFVAWDDGPALWAAMLQVGQADGLKPCGLGARDTLRLEAGMPLYGAELDRDTTPLEAGLGWAVRLDHDFVGRDALASAESRKQLAGLILRGRGIARHGYAVARAGEPEAVGAVTSGSQSPTLGEAIAMAYVRPEDAAAGTMLDIIIRGAAVPAEVVALPFYRRPGR